MTAIAENTELPLWQCHKKVRAAKIGEIGWNEDNSAVLFLVGDKYHSPVDVSHQWVNEKKAEAGGYYVEYADGYTSYSPAEAFEDGYTLID